MTEPSDPQLPDDDVTRLLDRIWRAAVDATLSAEIDEAARERYRVEILADTRGKLRMAAAGELAVRQCQVRP